MWKVDVKGDSVRVATVEHGGRKPSMCNDCSAPCCRGALRPVLNEHEFKTRRFPILFLESPGWLKEKAPRAQAIATLGMPKDGPCSYLDIDTNRCKAWPKCPEGCLAYDCREDDRFEICDFAQQRAVELGV